MRDLTKDEFQILAGTDNIRPMVGIFRNETLLALVNTDREAMAYLDREYPTGSRERAIEDHGFKFTIRRLCVSFHLREKLRRDEALREHEARVIK